MLTKIRVKNFKSLKDVSLDLGQRNVLVGANMAGKSNVIDLFKFISEMVFPRPGGASALSNAVFARGGLDEILWKGGNEEVLTVGLSGRDVFDDGAEWFWEYEIALQRFVGGSFRIISELLDARKSKNGPSNALIRTEAFNRYYRDINGHDVGQTNDQSKSMLEFEIPGWTGSLLRRAIASWHFYELVPPFMRNPNPTAASLFLTPHGENLSQWLLYLQSRYGDSFARIQTVLKDTLPEVKGLFTSPTQQSTVLLGTHEKHLNRPIMLSQMSAGELAFIAYLSLIFSPPELTGTLYCVEDLESYLHPRLIETLLEVLRQSQEEWQRKNEAAQILMTTHSPLVVDRTNLDEIIFVEKREGATVCSRPVDKANLRKLLEDGEVGLGDLAFSGALSNASR
jgi:predicted ATPase